MPLFYTILSLGWSKIFFLLSSPKFSDFPWKTKNKSSPNSPLSLFLSQVLNNSIFVYNYFSHIKQFLKEEKRASSTSDNEVQTNLHHLAFCKALPSVLHKGQEYDSTFHRFVWERVFFCSYVIFSLLFPKTEIV